jgi:hypothetical protein
MYKTPQELLPFPADSGAYFSPGREYRYKLWRRWDRGNLRMAMFIGLNPSTANEDSDDPTIRRAISFAKRWGCGGVIMMNLFPFVTAYPVELRKQETENSRESVNAGALNMELLMKNGCGYESTPPADPIVFAWGAFPEAKERGALVARMFPWAFCLGKNSDGSPKHPLYLSGESRLIRFSGGFWEP